jgi:hypothetical protein
VVLRRHRTEPGRNRAAFTRLLTSPAHERKSLSNRLVARNFKQDIYNKLYSARFIVEGRLGVLDCPHCAVWCCAGHHFPLAELLASISQRLTVLGEDRGDRRGLGARIHHLFPSGAVPGIEAWPHVV